MTYTILKPFDFWIFIGILNTCKLDAFKKT